MAACSAPHRFMPLTWLCRGERNLTPRQVLFHSRFICRLPKIAGNFKGEKLRPIWIPSFVPDRDRLNGSSYSTAGFITADRFFTFSTSSLCITVGFCESVKAPSLNGYIMIKLPLKGFETAVKDDHLHSARTNILKTIRTRIKKVTTFQTLLKHLLQRFCITYNLIVFYTKKWSFSFINWAYLRKV